MDKKASMADFAALLDGQFKNYRKGFNPGDTVTARVVRVGETHVTLDVNAKLVGLMPVEDVTDAEGEITVKRGDSIEVSFVSMQKDYYLFAKADVAESAAIVAEDETLRRAFDRGLALDGKVEKEVKGGYEVTVCGQRAFCPYSQIERFRKTLPAGAENPYIGQTFSFIVQEYSTDDRGLNLPQRHHRQGSRLRRVRRSRRRGGPRARARDIVGQGGEAIRLRQGRRPRHREDSLPRLGTRAHLTLHPPVPGQAAQAPYP